MISERTPVTVGDLLGATVSATTDLNRGEEMIPSISISPYNIVPWQPFSSSLPTGERLRTNEHLTEDLAELREETTVVENFDPMWSRFTPDFTTEYNINTRASWTPVSSRPFTFDPFGDDSDSSSSAQSSYHPNDARDDGQTSAVSPYIPALPPVPMYHQVPFKFDPFWDENVSASPESNGPADATYQHCFATGTNELALTGMVSSSATGATFEESTMTSSPDSFYDSDDSRVKCTVTAQGKIWAPVPIVPMAAALAAFEVHAFAVTLPSPMSVLVDSRSTGDRDDWAENKSSGSTLSKQKIADTEGSSMRRDRDIFVVFREDEDDVPAAELGPREANGNPAPYATPATESEMRGREGPFAVSQEQEDTPAAMHIPREANGNPIFHQTGPTARSGDIVTEMKNLLRMEPGKAKDAMATRLFGGESSRRAAPNAPRVPTIPLPAPTSPALEDNYEDLYGALEPAAPQPSTHLDSHQLSLLRVLCRGY